MKSEVQYLKHSHLLIFCFLWSCVPWFPVCIIILLLLLEGKGDNYKKYTAKE